MPLPADTVIRPIQASDDAAMAAIIRAVMPEFGATGSGFAISDPEVDWMSRAYAEPRHAYFVVEHDGRVIGGAGMAPLAGGVHWYWKVIASRDGKPLVLIAQKKQALSVAHNALAAPR